jgi:hypothetical protein
MLRYQTELHRIKYDKSGNKSSYRKIQHTIISRDQENQGEGSRKKQLRPKNKARELKPQGPVYTM